MAPLPPQPLFSPAPVLVLGPGVALSCVSLQATCPKPVQLCHGVSPTPLSVLRGASPSHRSPPSILRCLGPFLSHRESE